MDILVINAGSSSLKYQLIDIEEEKLIAKGIVERIGIEGSNLQHTPTGQEKTRIQTPIKTHTEAISAVLKALTNKYHGVIEDMSVIEAVGHRVVHGGEKFSASVLIDDEVKQAIVDNIALAPLHNPANIMGIEACSEIMPTVPQVAVFDTSFHQTMPPKAYLYGIPYDFYTEDKVRRYGFHGTSHRFIAQTVAKAMGKDASKLKIASCHLGNGGSVAAIDCGKSVDTSMGMTPLEGLLMGTRCGDIDPSLIEFLMKKRNLNIEEVMNILNKESGIWGVSKISADMRDIDDAVERGDQRAIETYNMYCYKVIKYIGAYAAAMGGLDCIVFTAGVGENNPQLRRDISKSFEFMGLEFDEERNSTQRGVPVYEITTDASKLKAFTIATDEELMIARDTYKIVGYKA
ncbi:MAG: acetate kinase [Clostridiales bacterium]|nr:acetate kinase [Clostridiales bacterium]